MSPDPRPPAGEDAASDRVTPTADSMRLKIARLERDRAILRNRLANAEWKHQAMRARRWWRLGAALQSFIRRPTRLREIGRDLRIAFSADASPPPRPALEEVPMVPAPDPAEASDASVLSPPVTDALVRPVRPTLRPLVVTAPQPMSLAPEAAATQTEIRVAAILDERSRRAFAPECRLTTFGPNNWLDVLERTVPQLLLVESAWRGNRGSWEYKVGAYDHPESVGLADLKAVVGWCRDRGIPTVFWHNVGSDHFERFREAAGLFDVMYTADPAMVERYRTVLDMARRTVDVLSFGVQPSINDPVGSLQERDPRPLLIVHGAEQPDRLVPLLDASMDYDPAIYVSGRSTVEDAVPERFSRQVLGVVSAPQMADVLRQYRLYLDAGAGGATSGSRALYAALASGTPVVAAAATGSEALDRIITVLGGAGEVGEALAAVSAGGAEWRSASLGGIEEVFARHTYADRLHQILDAVGIDVASPAPTVTAVPAPGANITPVEIADSSVVSEVVVPASGGKPVFRGSGRAPIRMVATAEGADEATVLKVLAGAAQQPWVAVVRRHADLAALESLSVATRITRAEVYTAAESAGTEHRFVAEPAASGPTVVSSGFLGRYGIISGSGDRFDWSAARVYAVPITDA